MKSTGTGSWSGGTGGTGGTGNAGNAGGAGGAWSLPSSASTAKVHLHKMHHDRVAHYPAGGADEAWHGRTQEPELSNEAVIQRLLSAFRGCESNGKTSTS